MSSTAGEVAGREAPRPEVLTALTDHHFLTVLATAAEPLSRAEVAARSGLSKPAISTAAVRLLGRGVIKEVGQRQGRRGGVATLLEVNAERGHSVALAVQADAVRVRARDFIGDVRFEGAVPLPHSVERETVAHHAKALLGGAAEAVESPLLAVTVSMAEPVDPVSGQPVAFPNLAFPGGQLNLRHDLDLGTMGALVVDNDVNWASLAEHRTGVAQDFDDFLYLYCGAGLGAGLFLGGRLHRGRAGLAGEIGYLRETDGTDLTQRLNQLGFGRPGVYGLDVDLARRLLTTEPSAPSTQEGLATLARHLGNLVTAVNPSAVVLSGPLADLPVFVARLREGMNAVCLDPPDFLVGTFAPLDGASAEAHRLALTAADFPSGVRGS